jgi:hypothetical protein
MRLSGYMAGRLRRKKMSEFRSDYPGASLRGPKVKLIIAGGRDFLGFPGMTGIAAVDSAVPNPSSVSEVVCGGARGADSRGAAWAEWHDIKVKDFPAEWDKYGKSAGYRRNVDMAVYADALLAFWDGESKGTKHMIDIAKDQGLLIKVYNYKGKRIDI